jgi:Domain of unknown function (DUF4157)/OmpA family
MGFGSSSRSGKGSGTVDGLRAHRAPGRSTLVAQRYPTLARAMPAADGRPTIDDVATTAVEQKGAGRAIDGGVSGQVGAHLGADFSSVKVHDDPLSQEATQAMGARAFAYGGDVFLGPGESDRDLGLMAHELTHVAQQGAAGQRAPQRQVQVGAADSPAETQADAVSRAVTGGTPPAALLVEGGAAQPGQMEKAAFLAQLGAAVTAAAAAELGPLWPSGQPYVEKFLAGFAGQPAAQCEASLKRFAPGAAAARAAGDLIAPVVARVRESAAQSKASGRPPDLSAFAPGAAAAPGAAPAQAQALRGPDGRESLASLEAELGAGQPLAAGIASRMSSALGVDVSGARIHTGPIAARKAADAGAMAFAAGDHVVMGGDAPAAGTLAGDALLAHELAHVAQQAGAARDPVARAMPLADEHAGAERDADRAAAAALANRSHPVKSSGLSLQRCNGGGKKSAPSGGPAPLPAAKTGTKKLAKGDMTWSLSAASQIKVDWSVDFKPDTSKVTYKNVSFVQTVVAQVGGNRAYPGTTASDPVGDKTTYSPYEEGTDHRRIDHLKDEYDPFYGAEQGASGWQAESRSWKVADNNTTADTAHITDGPSLSPSRKGLGDASREFETVPMVLETREALGSIKWGFRIKDAANSPVELLHATDSDCVDAPTAGVGAALDQFYAAKFDAILDGFGKNDATLSGGHKSQLDTVATKLTTTTTLKCKLGGAADLSETDPAAISLARANAAKTYLTSKGVNATQLEVESYGSDWAKEKTSAGAEEPKNRRVQVWVHP